jgi:hypothetical protein
MRSTKLVHSKKTVTSDPRSKIPIALQTRIFLTCLHLTRTSNLAYQFSTASLITCFATYNTLPGQYFTTENLSRITYNGTPELTTRVQHKHPANYNHLKHTFTLYTEFFFCFVFRNHIFIFSDTCRSLYFLLSVLNPHHMNEC